MADDRIEVEIVLDDGSIQKGFAKVRKEAKDTAKKSGASFKALLGPAAALGATLAAAFAGRKIIQAAQEQQDAVNNLAASLRNIGEESKQIELESFAAELQKVTVFGDEAIISQLAFAQAMGASADQSKEILTAATDMSAALGIDLNSAVRNISKTLGGYAGELGEVIPELKNLTQEQLQNGAGVELLAKKYAGFAQSEIKTFSGSVAQLENSFGDLLEKIGDLIIKNPLIIKGINGLKNIFDSLNENFVTIGRSIITYVISPLELLFNVGNIVFQSVRAGFQTIVVGIAQVAEGWARLAEVVGLDSPLTKGIIEFSETAKAQLVDFSNQGQDALKDVFNFDFTLAADNFVAGLDSAMERGNSSLSKGTKKMAKTAKKAEFNISQSLGAGISRAVQATVQALANGENAFAAFGSAVLGVFGDLAIQLGQFFIINGIAVEALKSLGGAAAIAAGIALIALGTLLKAASGGGSSAPIQPGGETAGDGGPVATADVGGPTGEDIEDIEEQQKVVVNVEGTVLDPQGVGLQIAEVLNEAGFGNGAVTA